MAGLLLFIGVLVQISFVIVSCIFVVRVIGPWIWGKIFRVAASTPMEVLVKLKSEVLDIPYGDVRLVVLGCLLFVSQTIVFVAARGQLREMLFVSVVEAAIGLIMVIWPFAKASQKIFFPD